MLEGGRAGLPDRVQTPKSRLAGLVIALLRAKARLYFPLNTGLKAGSSTRSSRLVSAQQKEVAWLPFFRWIALPGIVQARGDAVHGCSDGVVER
jgi:hypothetical protein